LAMIAGSVWIVSRRGVGVLRRQNDVLAVAIEQFAKNPLARPLGVEIRRVNEVAARFAVGVVDFPGLVFCRTPAPLLAEGHSPQRQFAHAQSASSQQSIVHGDWIAHSGIGCLASVRLKTSEPLIRSTRISY